MKILYIHQYFKTPDEGGPIRSYYLAKGLVENGFDVELITAHNKPNKEIKVVDGITVHYLPVPYENDFGFNKRIMSFVRFMYKAVDEGIQIKDADICYATSTPLTIGLSAIKIKQKLGIPFFFEVRDLWPEAPFQMGAIKNPLLKKYALQMEERIYNEADKIIALSPGIGDSIKEKNENANIHFIPNMSDIDFFHPEEKIPYLEDEFNVSEKFVIGYFGAMGKANHLDYILENAQYFQRENLPVLFLIIGQGSEKSRLIERAREMDLTNVRFLPFVNKENLRIILNITDAAYISFAKKPILETNSPNKFFDALASGKLVITNTQGWLKDLVEKHHFGFYADPEKPYELAQKLSEFIKDKSKLSNYQHNARQMGESHFSKDLQIKRLIDLLHTA